ncbi:MAG TPA: methyl-accepting chemotaxis protein [Burkholderiaceae bacterium]|nr:methyl-accepting chemotaxis protein [Burkholderiaceae bacterium]
MDRFNRIRISVRLVLVFGGVFAIMLLMAVIATINLRQSEGDTRELLVLEREAYLADEWMSNTQLNVTRVLAVAKSKADPNVDAYFKPLIAQTTERINELQKQLEAQVTEPEGKALLSDIAAKRKAYIDVRKTYFDTLKGGDMAKAEELLASGVLPAADAYVASQRKLVKFQHDAVTVESGQRLARQQARLWVLDGLAVVGVLLSLLMAWALMRSITQPLERAVGFAKGIAAGRLDQAIEVDRSDEIGVLLQSLNDMQTALQKMIQNVTQTVGQIDVAATEVATGNQDLSARTEAAASNLEQTASSMEEITATVKQSADAARQANQLASTAANVAAKGGEVVGQVVGTMQDISHSSQKIADIIGVIDGIAFQTNILALNAAVEAARAGEQGRGFAVVAGEVRNLAQRSAQAAKEIKDLINASVDKVQTGSALVQDAGATMEEIVASVKRVNDIIGEITAAAQEQSNGIAQVNTAVAQLDHMTQQNAALVEESAAAAQSLRDQALRLTEAVSAFHTGTRDVALV